MNFFERQQQVKKISARLVILFLIAVAGIVVIIDLVVLFAFGLTDKPLADIILTLVVATVATIAVITLASLFRTVGLRSGGGKVALELGGVQVPEDTTDPELRRLRNVVEEIALASGVPVPEVYVLEHERAINAFAAGWSPADAAVAVTRGALDRLNRDELQGVIAHEFSHVLNGDMRINIRLIGLLFGILFLAVIGRTFLYAGAFGGGRSRGGGSREGGSNPLPLVGIALLAAGYFGVLIGRLIQASVSRQREYLADASAVQFTRQTSGIAGALKKIGGLGEGSKLRTPKTEEVGHMLFGAGAGLSSLFATHPPLVKRIQVLEPDFQPDDLTQLARGWASAPPSGLAEDRAMGLAGTPAAAGAGLPAAGAAVAAEPRAVVNRIGAPSDTAYQQVEAILGSIPEDLRARTRRSDLAVPLLFGLLLSEQPDAQASQLAVLTARHGPELASAAAAEANELAALHQLLRLPLAQLTFPVLRMHSAGGTGPSPEQLIGTVDALVRADGRLTVFEYCFSRLLHRDLYESAYDTPPWSVRRRSVATSQAAILNLLATLAYAGHTGPGEAAQAFRAGLDRILPGVKVEYRQPEHGVLALEPGWPDLDGLAPADKERLVEALVTVVGHDGMMTVQEAELVRTVCAMVHCPLPPMF